MNKKLKKPGKNISVSVQGISVNGLWMLVNNEEYFLLFDEFPWFLKATLEQIYNLELIHEHHLHWPDIDIELDLESIKNPAAFPKIAHN